MNFTLVFLYIIVILLGFKYPKSKAVMIIALLFSWLLMAGNYLNADYENYVFRYERGMEVFVDIGFSFLCSSFSQMGLNYQEFKAIISLTCLVFIYRTIYKLSIKPALGAVLFLVFPFIIDITQFRNFVSYSIVFVAIPYLFDNNKISLIKYVGLVLFAATIHITSIFYLLFITSRFKVKYWQIALLAILVYMLKEFFKNYFSVQLNTDKLEGFSQTSLLGALFGALIVVLNFLLILFVYKNKRQNSNALQTRGVLTSFNTEKTWLFCNALLILIIPFLFDNANYARIYRNIAVLNMIFINNVSLKNNVQGQLIMVLYYGYFIYSSYLSNTYFDEIVAPIFTYNSFF